ncbi:transport protein particle component [Aureobasidium sp. EXF-8845]|nr:transport protein particle component [Aureobasidium sp. EXF-8845]KAI4844124.1 transport protein particle component [Aureobasidium sp. EXF-8846]
MATTTPNTDSSSSDPKVAASTLDFLLIELVPLAQRIATDLHARDTALLSSSLERNATLNTSTLASSTTQQQALPLQPNRSSLKTTTATAPSTSTPLNDDDDTDPELSTAIQESVHYRLDALGYRVGLGLVEKLSQYSARPTTPLDMIKFICKDLWQVVFRKQIDNLKTNHRGTFVLTDNKFLALGRMSVDRGRGPRGTEEALGKAQPFLYFPCGIIRGALSAFGLNVTVHAETSELPQAIFQIRTVGSKP